MGDRAESRALGTPVADLLEGLQVSLQGTQGLDVRCPTEPKACLPAPREPGLALNSGSLLVTGPFQPPRTFWKVRYLLLRGICVPPPPQVTARLGFDAATSGPGRQWALYTTRRAAGGRAGCSGRGRGPDTQSHCVGPALDRPDPVGSGGLRGVPFQPGGTLWTGRVVWGDGVCRAASEAAVKEAQQTWRQASAVAGTARLRSARPSLRAPGEEEASTAHGLGVTNLPGCLGFRGRAAKPQRVPAVGYCLELRPGHGTDLTGLGSFLPVR